MNCFPNIVFVELHLAYSHFTPIPDLRKKRFTATFVSYLIAILSLNMGADTFSTTDMILVGVICVCCSAALAVLVALICCRWRYSRRGHLPLPATAWEKLVLPSWSVALPLPPPVLRWESMFTLHSSFLHAIDALDAQIPWIIEPPHFACKRVPGLTGANDESWFVRYTS